MSRYEVLAHTADTGIATEGATLEDAICNAAYAMFDLMYELDDATSGTPVELSVDAAAPPDLLVAVLSELLYRSEVDDAAYTGISLRRDGERFVIRATAHPVPPELHGPPIKAVTYHDLVCEPADDGWIARVIFDV